MKIKDRIYGEIKIKEKVIEELILSKPLQRLKKINQDGATHFIQPSRNVNRFEHSIGVWYLSSRFKRSIEEQIACLLHDVPHTAFSHVIDFVVKDKDHEFHEKFARKIILNSEIPGILIKHKIDIEKVLQKERFPLLENNLPDISFDRWDYFMRDGFTIGFLPKTLINEFLKNIHLEKQVLYFKDVNLASTFSILFVNFSRLIWLDPTSHGAYALLVNALKLAMDKKVITQDDFFSNDEILLKKMQNSKDSQIKKILKRLKPGNEFVYSAKRESEFFGPNKPRYVNPLVKNKGNLKRVSDLVPSLGYYFEEFSAKYKKIGVRPI